MSGSLIEYTISSITYAMKWMDAGSFTMGTPDTEKGRYDDEGPQHTVTLSAFWMGATEVTQGQYQSITGQNPSHFSSCGSSCPVEQVSWCDAVAFCNRLSQQEGLTPAYQLPAGFALGMDRETCNTRAKEVKRQRGADGYRLPTEAEWEYATRAGTATPYWSGSQESDLARVEWYDGNSGGHTHPVKGKGQDKGASPWGLYDVHGNVWEWVWDRYGSYPSGGAVDPAGPSSGSLRVIRGGCYSLSASWARSGCRDSWNPGNRNRNLGFRLARSPAP